MIFTSEKAKEMFSYDYDQYGDSYAEDVSKEDLKKIFQNIAAEVACISLIYATIHHIDWFVKFVHREKSKPTVLYC